MGRVYRQSQRRRHHHTSGWDTFMLSILFILGFFYLSVQYEVDRFVGEIFASTVFCACGYSVYYGIRLTRKIALYCEQQQVATRRRQEREAIQLYERMHPFDFERLVALGLRYAGWHTVDIYERIAGGYCLLRIEANGVRVLVIALYGRDGRRVTPAMLDVCVRKHVAQVDAIWIFTTTTFTPAVQQYAATHNRLRLLDGCVFAHMINQLPSSWWQDNFCTQSYFATPYTY